MQISRRLIDACAKKYEYLQKDANIDKPKYILRNLSISFKRVMIYILQ